MQEATRSPASQDSAGELAAAVLKDLYHAVAGRQPKAVRTYQDDDALLLLLRFDADEIEDTPLEQFGPLLESAFIAMPGMIASAVEARGGQRLAPGNLSVCSDRGLAVFAFTTVEDAVEDSGDEDLFDIDAAIARDAALGRLPLRLAS